MRHLRSPPAVTLNDPDYPLERLWRAANLDILWKSYGGEGTVVGVLNTGVRTTHEELTGRVVAGYGPVGDSLGWGTVQAGIVAAKANNGVGGVGGVGGCNGCSIMPLNDLATDGATMVYESDVIKAMDYGISKKVAVLDFDYYATFKDTPCSPAMQAEVNKAVAANIPLVVPVVTTSAVAGIAEPGNCSNVISAIDTGQNHIDTSSMNIGRDWEEEDTLSAFSLPYANPNITIGAPGYYDRPLYYTGDSDYYDGGIYDSSSNLVASVLAILKKAYPNATVAQLTKAITATVDPCCSKQELSSGRINAAKAMAYLKGNGVVADTKPPVFSNPSPADNSSIFSGGKVSINVTDDVAIGRVDFYANGRIVAEVSEAPYEFTYPSYNVFPVKAVAIDSSGNSATFNWPAGGTTPPTPTPPPPTPTPTPPTPPPTPTPQPPTPPPSPNPTPIGKTGDLNGDNKVNISDLSILLSNWGK